MKTCNYLIVLAVAFVVSILTGSPLQAQQMVSAKTIMTDIKNGQEISYENSTIVGVLDFTFLEDRELADSWWDRYWNGKFESRSVIKEQISIPVTFINCTFEDDVLAYIRLERQNYTLIANFSKPVLFKNCTFKGGAQFKHSEFASEASFSGTQFEGDTSFKYSEFYENADFSRTDFLHDATFKYANFLKNANWEDAMFHRKLDMRYMQISGEWSSSDMTVKGEMDAHYANIQGKSLVTYLFSRQ